MNTTGQAASGLIPPKVTTRPVLTIEASKGLFHLDLAAVWEFRELLYFLVWRDVSVRYKQTLIGVAWAVLQPVLSMVVFTVVFGRFAGLPSDGSPYSITVFAALLPWTYFAQSINRSGVSLVTNSNMVGKVYFPRLIIPLTGALSPLVDFVLSFIVLLLMMLWFGIQLQWTVLALPVFLLVTAMTALAVAFWLAPLHAKYRDVGHAIPFLVQFWMFASPVAYTISVVPEKWRALYGLNPMVGVIEGFRWALLGKESPDFLAMAVSTSVVLALLVSGVVFFKRMERTLADVI